MKERKKGDLIGAFSNINTGFCQANGVFSSQSQPSEVFCTLDCAGMGLPRYSCCAQSLAKNSTWEEWPQHNLVWIQNTVPAVHINFAKYTTVPEAIGQFIS